MAQNGAGVVLVVEGVHEELIVAHTSLDRLGNLCEDLLCRLDEDPVNMFFLADLLEQYVQGLDPFVFLVYLKRIAQIEEVLEVPECDRYTMSVRRSPPGRTSLTSPTTVSIALHDPHEGMGDSKSLSVQREQSHRSIQVKERLRWS